MEYKGYMIKPLDSLLGYEIEYIGRGSSHLSLRGMFTSTKIAREFIDRYETLKEEKEEERGETVQRSGSKQIQRRSNYRRKSVNNS